MEDLKFKTAEDVMNWSNDDSAPAFQSNNNCGFTMDVNGFRISIQFGPGNYIRNADIRYRMDFDEPKNFNHFGTDSAEVLIWDRDCNAIKWRDKGTVVGWCSSDCVAKFIGCLASCGDGDPTNSLRQIYESNMAS